MEATSNLQLLLDFLIGSAAPLPDGSHSQPPEESDALRGEAPRKLLVSYHQVVTRIVDLAQVLCGCTQTAVISQLSSSRKVDAQAGLSTQLLADLRAPSTEDVSVDWQSRTGGTVSVLDAYGDTTIYLCVAWPQGEPSPDHIEQQKVLVRVASAALRFQRKAASSRRRARWITASRSLVDALLDGADEEEALELVAEAARVGAGADAALIFLPSVGGDWTCEIVAGDHTDGMVGMAFPTFGDLNEVRTGRRGLIHDPADMAPLGTSQTLSEFGPLVVAPIYSQDSTDGAIVLLRGRGREPFAPDDLSLTESLASQTSLALEVASARHSRSLAVMLEERERISRDLHDFAVQQLFATGMKLEVLREASTGEHRSARSLTDGLVDAMESLEEAVRQIRAIVRDLKDTDIINEPFVERMEREASLSRQVLGFAPSLLFELDGHIIDPLNPSARDLTADLSARIDRSITDDAVAIVREALSNVARHAHARAVKIEISASGHGVIGELTIGITDDGVGVDPTETRSSGLSNMATRARLHGGSFGVGAGPRGVGTSLVWRVPLDQA